MRSMIDATMGGTLKTKTEDEAYNLIEGMTLNNYQWSNERTHSKVLRRYRILIKFMKSTT